MSNPGPSQTDKPKRRLTWIAVLLLIAGIYAFWILPAQMGPRHVKVQFDQPAK